MARVNKKATPARKEPEKTHGGTIVPKITPLQKLRRTVLTTLLWEDNYYEDGETIANRISKLVKDVEPNDARNVAVEARTKMNLRHVPLYVTSEMAKSPKHRPHVRETIKEVVRRADEMPELLALYWKDKRHPIPAQMKKGLADKFGQFDEYQLAKYNRDNPIKLRDVMFLTHPKPKDDKQADMWKRLAEDNLKTPDTWETNLSAGKDKKETFTRLTTEKKLGAMATLKNVRNMVQSGVDRETIRDALVNGKGKEKILPWRYVSAAEACPEMKKEIEEGLLASLRSKEKLPGKTVFVIDVSGSMYYATMGANAGRDRSERELVGNMNRMKVAATMAAMMKELCEEAVIYVTAGSDASRIHKTQKVTANKNGFDMIHHIERELTPRMGGGGIFLKQCMDYVSSKEGEADRVIVLTDEQDCAGGRYNPDAVDTFGKRNYILNVSNSKNGVGYGDKWIHIDGFSGAVADYIREFEKAGL